MSHSSNARKSDESLALVHAHAAGLDIGSDEIWAAVPADDDPAPVRQFGTFTPDLLALADSTLSRSSKSSAILTGRTSFRSAMWRCFTSSTAGVVAGRPGWMMRK